VLNHHPPADAAARTKNRLICPTAQANRAARSVTGLPPTAAASARPRLSTVHQIKGDQGQAVLLFMPAGPATDRTLTAWLASSTSDPEVTEALRVVYVAVTRAQRLLGLAVPPSGLERLLGHLHRHTIPTELR
jgi:superfamily I DNA/RNA helicase